MSYVWANWDINAPTFHTLSDMFYHNAIQVSFSEKLSFVIYQFGPIDATHH